MPPAGRAPPCTRWGASRPPDPGITADAKGFRIQLALDTEPFCVRRLVFVGSPPFEVTVTRSIFVINTKKFKNALPGNVQQTSTCRITVTAIRPVYKSL